MPVRNFNIDALRPWIELRFDASSGPGGQHVNKVATRATLLFDFENCELISSREAQRIRQRLDTRLSRDGRLRIVAQRERTQIGNREQAERRLLELLGQALRVERKRVPTRPTKASQRRRVNRKRQRGELKRQRQSRPSPE